NAAAGRAEAALASLRASGQETDLLHDRIIKAREVKAQLEALIARGPAPAAAPAAAPIAEPETPAPSLRAAAPAPAAPVQDDDRAARMAALAERTQGMTAPARARAPGGGDVAAILGAMTANQSAKQSL